MEGGGFKVACTWCLCTLLTVLSVGCHPIFPADNVNLIHHTVLAASTSLSEELTLDTLQTCCFNLHNPSVNFDSGRGAKVKEAKICALLER